MAGASTALFCFFLRFFCGREDGWEGLINEPEVMDRHVRSDQCQCWLLSHYTCDIIQIVNRLKQCTHFVLLTVWSRAFERNEYKEQTFKKNYMHVQDDTTTPIINDDNNTVVPLQ